MARQHEYPRAFEAISAELREIAKRQAEEIVMELLQEAAHHIASEHGKPSRPAKKNGAPRPVRHSRKAEAVEELSGEGDGEEESEEANRPSNAPLERWVADRAARRVPRFVTEMTGLDVKASIVAKYGEGAVFEIGKPPPPRVN